MKFSKTSDIFPYLREFKTFFLTGPVGIGKTHFVKEYLWYLYEYDQVSSPTFLGCNTYETCDGLVYHFDCYLKKNLLFEIKVALSENAIVFIEWPIENLNIPHVLIDFKNKEVKFPDVL